MSSSAATTTMATATDDRLVSAAEHAAGLLVHGGPQRDTTAAVQTLLDVAGEATGGPRPGGAGHVLCELFEDLCIALRALIEAPGTAVDAIVDRLTPHWLPQAALRVALKALLNALIRASPLASTLEACYLKSAVLAVVTCPDQDEHPSLDQNCAIPLVRAASTPDSSG